MEETYITEGLAPDEGPRRAEDPSCVAAEIDDEAGEEAWHFTLPSRSEAAGSACGGTPVATEVVESTQDGRMEEPSEVSATPSKRPRICEVVPVIERGFVISLTQKKKITRLHYIGACHRTPGVFYQHYEYWGSVEPERERYMYRRKDCWPESQGKKPPGKEGQEDPPSSDSSSSASEDSERTLDSE